MNRSVARRAFLKSAPAAAGMMAYAAQDHGTFSSSAGLMAANVRISSVTYKPVPDYPIRAKSYREVSLRDGFRKSPRTGVDVQEPQGGGVGDFRDGGLTENFNYWTSTQSSADMAAHIDFADFGRNHSDDKDFPRRVRAIRAF